MSDIRGPEERQAFWNYNVLSSFPLIKNVQLLPFNTGQDPPK